jgi:glucoamylase
MRDIPVGNGSLLINFDDKYRIRDIYFPHVGQENHTEGLPCRLGIWVDGNFSWISEDGWDRTLRYKENELVTDVLLKNVGLGIEINANDMVSGRENILVRRFSVRDTTGNPRSVRVFFHHDLRIYEHKIGDTAYYDPLTNAIVHYKKHRYFLINSLPHFEQFATGRKAFRDREGTWRDAEDGELQGGAKTEGSVDSTIGIHLEIEPNGAMEFFTWLAVGTTYHQVSNADRRLVETGPSEYFQRCKTRWNNWVNKHSPELTILPKNVSDLFDRSLMLVRAHCDHQGAIIAAADHDVTERATDHYSYLWTRDGAFVAEALDRVGLDSLTIPFFELCHRVVDEHGYFHQKYNPDGTLGSGWHASWDQYRKRELLPIQEDETSLVIWALWRHFEKLQDKNFVHLLYPYLIEKSCDFLMKCRDGETGLPLPTWNLWEDRRGVHTFTCASVVAGLRAGANFARLFDHVEKAAAYDDAADQMVVAMREHLYSAQLGRFLRGLLADGDDNLSPDTTVDASLFGVFYFGCFDIDDVVVTSTMRAIVDHLSVGGGIARFENDGYMRVGENAPPNAWFICTLWLADFYIASAKSTAELAKAMELIEWCADRALPSGVLSEQFDTVHNQQISVSPLTWSHSTFIATVDAYVSKFEQLTQGENA